MLLEANLSGKGRKTGVDLGLIKLAALSDTSYVQYPKFLKQAEDKPKQQQRSLSQKEKGSVNYREQQRVLARTHEHRANQRQDFLHKVSLCS